MRVTKRALHDSIAPRARHAALHAGSQVSVDMSPSVAGISRAIGKSNGFGASHPLERDRRAQRMPAIRTFVHTSSSARVGLGGFDALRVASRFEQRDAHERTLSPQASARAMSALQAASEREHDRMSALRLPSRAEAVVRAAPVGASASSRRPSDRTGITRRAQAGGAGSRARPARDQRISVARRVGTRCANPVAEFASLARRRGRASERRCRSRSGACKAHP